MKCARTEKAGNDDIDLMHLVGLVGEWAESEKKVYLILKRINWKSPRFSDGR